MSRLRRRLWKWSAALVAAVLILLAVGVGLFRLAVPLVPELRADAEAMAEGALGWPVHIGEIDLQWALFGPELVLTDVQLLAPDSRKPLVTAARLDIIFGPLDLFQRTAARPNHVRLYEPTLALERAADGTLFLSGYALPVATDSRVDWRQLLDLGLRHGRVTILDGELHYRDDARNIDDWTLRLADVTLASDGEHHEFEGKVMPPQPLGEQVTLAFSARGAPGRPEEWRWTLEFNAEEMQLDAWYRQLGWQDLQVHVAGRLNVQGSMAGTGLETARGSGALELAGLEFRPIEPVVGPMENALPGHFDAVALEWAVKFGADRFELGVNDLALEHAGAAFEGGAFSVRTGAGEYPLQVAAARLPLAEIAGLARLLPAFDVDPGAAEDSVRSVLATVRESAVRFAPRGELRELNLGLDFTDESPRFLAVAAFNDLGLQRWQGIPGFDGLSGSLRGTGNGGQLLLDSRDVSLDFGDVFRGPLPAQRLAAALSWKPAGDGWRVQGSDILVMNPEVGVTAAMTLDLPADGPAVIDMVATARDVDLSARSAWLPVGLMSEALVRWLDSAIIDGQVPEARLVLRGPLEKFPFPDGGGTFDIRFRTENTDVEYLHGWPRIEGMSADVHFHGPALDIAIDRARVMDLSISDGLARFPELRAAALDVTATATGDMTAAWAFLAASPLRETLGGLLDALEVSGPMQARVAMDIPLKDADAMTLQVDADLERISVHPVALPWTVDALEGRVTVTESTISAPELAGSFTGHPFTAAIVPVAAARPGRFSPAHIRMQGRTPVDAFESVLPAAWLARLDGAFAWNGELTVPGANEALRIALASTLEGVSSALPAPLDNVRPAHATITLPGESRIDATFQVEELGAGRLGYAATAAGWQFDSGRLALGADAARGTPVLPEAPGLVIEGRVDVLALNDWMGLGIGGGDGTADPEDTGGTMLLRTFDLHADRMLAGRAVLQDQALRGTRLDDAGGWEFILSGPANGRIRIPEIGDVSQPWTVTLSRLHLPADDNTGEAAAREPENVPDPRRLPGIRFDVGDLRVGQLTLGHVTGELQRTAIGYTTQNLHAATSSFDLDLDGRWEVVKDQHYTSVSAVLDSRDVEKTFSELGYQGGIDADNGRIEVNLAWHAAPMAMAVGSLEGTIGFVLRDGSLEELNPGAGRLLGLLSISALPRRLMLDFSDFFGEGLSFDTLGGDFLVTGGNAYTTNVTLDGPSVSGLLVGRTGLVARDYDQLAIIDPDVSASLPVAGYLAGGPTVGAALLLLSQLLKAPLADATQVKYRITGSWDDPVIAKVEQDSNAQKKTPSGNR